MSNRTYVTQLILWCDSVFSHSNLFILFNPILIYSTLLLLWHHTVEMFHSSRHIHNRCRTDEWREKQERPIQLRCRRCRSWVVHFIKRNQGEKSAYCCHEGFHLLNGWYVCERRDVVVYDDISFDQFIMWCLTLFFFHRICSIFSSLICLFICSLRNTCECRYVCSLCFG